MHGKEKPRSRPWVGKWLNLAVEMSWATTGKPALSTGGKCPKIFELTEAGENMILKTSRLTKGAMLLALLASSAAESLYLATNSVDGLEAWRMKRAAARRRLRRDASAEPDFVVKAATPPQGRLLQLYYYRVK